ncbi:TIGR02569 family protein [Nakamurella antarctica]|uniref:TIGR02569 family protein n=1 Tax=Nakamurella antarctica TaxID=1902245 RepID=A0A3G8ZQS4_9ACTN|nr:TIGR02569 family protein [Nakamurella antarctica]
MRSAFAVAAAEPQHLPGGRSLAFRCGDVVLKPVDNAAEASWLAAAFEQLRVDGIRIARPVRSSDGRWVVSGWSAQRFVSGRPAPRFGEIISVGVELHRALAGLPRPKFLDHAEGLYSWADRISWGESAASTEGLGEGVGADTFAALAAGRHDVDLPSQVVHGDLVGNVLFAGSAPPAVIDITPFWRPPLWASAVAVVDAVAWGGADPEMAAALQQQTHWRQMLRRALMFRLAISLAHPRSTSESLVGVLSAVQLLEPMMNENLPGLGAH